MSLPPNKEALDYLRNNGMPHAEQADGTIIVVGNIDLSNQGIENLPDFSNVLLQVNFDCSKNKLKSLRGAPRMVKGNFVCHNNSLESLALAPRDVGGNFNCRYNFLKTLEGGPLSVGGMLACENNHLQSLKGAPNEIGETITCAGNPELEHFEGLPMGNYAIYSDLGNFENMEAVPHELRMSQKARQDMLSKSTSVQKDTKINLPRFGFKK